VTASITGSALTGRVIIGALLLVAAMAVVEYGCSPNRPHPQVVAYDRFNSPSSVAGEHFRRE
jgi:hypothetical protein